VFIFLPISARQLTADLRCHNSKL